MFLCACHLVLPAHMLAPSTCRLHISSNQLAMGLIRWPALRQSSGRDNGLHGMLLACCSAHMEINVQCASKTH